MNEKPKLYLGIEAGGTKTIAIAANEGLQQVARVELGPANLRLIRDKDFLSLLRGLKKQIGVPAGIGIGLPGMRTAQDETRVKRLLKEVWPASPARVTHDLDLIVQAAELNEPAAKHLTKVVVLSGTGSCCFARSVDGRTAKLGGWGHLLGDRGSGYDIALRGCRSAIYYFDRDNEWTSLGQGFLRDLALNEPNDLIGWIQSADKKQIAALAPIVFEAWAKKDRHAADIVETAAHGLASDAIKCAARLEQPDATVQFIFAGSVLVKQPRFAEFVAEGIRKAWPLAVVTPVEREGAWGGVKLAFESGASAPHSKTLPRGSDLLPVNLEKSPTELRNPRSLKLDKLSSRAAVDLFLKEDSYVTKGLQKIARQIARALDLISVSLKKGGRLFYVGAGTSGRLGVLDASECPPTFRSHPDQVQGIIAGGQPALWKAVEGAEDDPSAGARAVEGRAVGAKDIVLGIAASGRTPFVWGALTEAKKRKAKIILLTLNPKVAIPKSPKLDLLLAADVGAELLTGSTRLKSGTATKLVLNILTTMAMVRLGKVASNLMIDLNPSNVKLRDRAVRIVQEITGVAREEAEKRLVRSGWNVKQALRNKNG